MRNSANDLTHQEKILVEWEILSNVLVQGHYEAAKRDSWWNHTMGVLVIAATTIAGSTVFANLGGTTNHTSWELTAGILAIIATILGSEQKYLRLEEGATRHEFAARAHQALLQQIEILIAKRQDGATIDEKQIEVIKNQWDEIEKASPTIPKGIYFRTNQAVRECMECRAVVKAIGRHQNAAA